MSYEGYTELLCVNGHHTTASCYEEINTFDVRDTCPQCKEVFVFRHEVDQTNDEGVSYPLEVEEEAEYQVCNLGHTHEIRPRRYKIPERINDEWRFPG